jgi:hypothetical protein
MPSENRSNPSAQPYKDVKYASLDEQELETPSLQLSPPSTLRTKIWAFTFGVATTVLIAILILLSTRVASKPRYIPDTVPDDDWNHCGRSSKVAIEKGCKMEPLFYGWMPAQCVFSDLTDQFPVFEDRTWYQDRNMTITVPPEDLWAGKHAVIYTKRYAAFALFGGNSMIESNSLTLLARLDSTQSIVSSSGESCNMQCTIELSS